MMESVGYYTSRYSGEEIDSRLDGIVRQNMFDNPYFVGGGTGWGTFPVNQTGIYEFPQPGPICSRWKANASPVIIGPDSLIVTSVAPLGIYQTIDCFEALSGKTVTLSFLISDATTDVVLALISGDFRMDSEPLSVPGLAVFTCALPELTAPLEGWCYTVTSGQTQFISAKLEIGTGQTHAYKDVTGAWKLFETPDYRTELWKCQSDYQLYRTAALRPQYAADCRPVMRTDPAQGIIQIGGITYYYNDARL